MARTPSVKSPTLTANEKAVINFLGLTLSQYELGFSDIFPSDIAEGTAISKKSVGGVVSSLHKKGLVETEETDVNGATRYFVHLTKAGWNAVPAVAVDFAAKAQEVKATKVAELAASPVVIATQPATAEVKVRKTDIGECCITFVKKDHGFRHGTRNALRMEYVYTVGAKINDLLGTPDGSTGSTLAPKKLTMADINWNLKRGDIKVG